MSLRDQMQSDLRDLVFNTDDFAQVATYKPVTGAEYSLKVVFSAEYIALDQNGIDSTIQSSQPAVKVIESEVQTQPITGDKLVVNSVTYRVAQYHPSGRGTGLLSLWRE
jgi:hypothetical protein